MSACPSIPPRNTRKVKCVLEDTREDHYLGHEGFDDRNGGRLVQWDATRDDQVRWC